MLNKEPNKRPSAKEALLHGYFNEKEKKGFTINDMDLVSGGKEVVGKKINLFKKINSLENLHSVENFN